MKVNQLKKRTILGLCALALTAVATPAYALSPKLAKSLSLEEEEQPKPPKPPIRMAKVKAKIEKMSFVKVGTKYEWKKETVCQKSAEAGVYDLRDGSIGGGVDMYPIKCNSTRGEKSIVISVGGIVAYGHAKIFDDEPKGDFKLFYGVLLVGQPMKSEDYIGQASGTRDLNQKSALFEVRPQVTGSTSCASSTSSDGQPAEETCTSDMPEYFTANVEFQD